MHEGYFAVVDYHSQLQTSLPRRKQHALIRHLRLRLNRIYEGHVLPVLRNT